MKPFFLRWMSAGVAAAMAFFAGESALQAEVVRPVPPLTVGGKALAGFRGQPVILLIAPSPQSRAFRRQLRRIEAVYPEFEARRAVFAVAFTQAANAPVASTIPLLKAGDLTAFTSRYLPPNAHGDTFAIAVIGRDGNLDLILPKAVPAATIMDMIINNGEQQAEERK